jgi:hypothetical protein
MKLPSGNIEARMGRQSFVFSTENYATIEEKKNVIFGDRRNS